jgi:hypothetical protein
MLSGACHKPVGAVPETRRTPSAVDGVGAAQARREFEFQALPEAAGLLRRIVREPGDIDARQELADVYRRAGYGSLAEFFAATVVVLRGEGVPKWEIPADVKWLCPDTDEQLLRGSPASKAAAERSAVGEFREAAEGLRRAIERDGFSCFLAVQWSEAALYDAVPLANDVDWLDLELALRVFLTGFEEVHSGPAGDAGSAAGFETLSGVFLGMSDHVSCYTAAMIAPDRLASEEVLPEWAREAMIERLQELKQLCEPRPGGREPQS